MRVDPNNTKVTLTLADANTYIRFTHGAGVTVNIPSNADVAFPLYTEITLRDETGMSSAGIHVDALSPAHINGGTWTWNLQAVSAN